jgi:hypothetical protein
MSEQHFYGRILTPAQDGVGRALRTTYDPSTDSIEDFCELIRLLDNVAGRDEDQMRMTIQP